LFSEYFLKKNETRRPIATPINTDKNNKRIKSMNIKKAILKSKVIVEFIFIYAKLFFILLNITIEIASFIIPSPNIIEFK
jgi:hypothetical protein